MDGSRLMKPVRALALLLLPVLVHASCSTDSTTGAAGPTSPIPPCDGSEGTVRPIWDRLAPESPLPLPSDWFTRPDPTSATGLRLDLVLGGNVPEDYPLFLSFPNVAAELNTLDGWGTSASGGTVLDGLLDFPGSGAVPESSTQDFDPDRWLFDGENAAIVYLDVDPTSPRFGERTGAIAFQIDNGALVVEPLRALSESTRHALVFTRRLRSRSAGGNGCVAPSTAWDAARAGEAGAPELEAHVRSAVEAVGAADPSLPEHDLVLVLPFTTQVVVAEMLEARDLLTTLPEPEIVSGSVEIQHLDEGPTAVRMRGRFHTPDLRGEDGVWTRDPTTGGLEVAGRSEVPFLIQIPREVPGGHRSPFPMGVYMHGLGGGLDELGPFHGVTSESGLAVIVTAAVAHRERSGLGAILEFFNIAEIAQGGPSALRVIRENFRQSTLDQLQASRLLRRLAAEGLDLAEPIGVPDLDPDLPMAAVGMSLGGIMGTPLAAITPEIEVAALFAGGGVQSNMVSDDPIFRPIVPNVLQIVSSGNATSRVDQQVTLAALQTILDRGDGASFGRHLFEDPLPGQSAKNVLLMIAVRDGIVPNSSSEALARAIGMPIVAPVNTPVSGMGTSASPARRNVAPGVTAGYTQFEFVRLHPDGRPVPANHATVFLGLEPRLQARHFLRTFYAGLSTGDDPEIIDGYEAVDRQGG